MAENDIYNNQKRYERFIAGLDQLVVEPIRAGGNRRGKRKYWVKNPENLTYFRKLDNYFRAADRSYVRRNRVFGSLLLVCHVIRKNLNSVEREDIDTLLIAMHETYNTVKSKETFIVDLKFIWKVLFPETDEKGRPDETIVPYVVRHLSRKIDRSRQKLRPDKLSWDEYERIVDYFSNDPRMQAYLTLSLESLARPQELLFIRLKSVELFENYAKLYITEHGKEGVGLLQCIDSYPYLLRWIEVHPQKNDQDAFLFINTGRTNNLQQLKPFNINKALRKACTELGINKPITCYTLKRNGVTMRRLRGDSDVEIQHAARWTSTDQLKTYDLSVQDEAMQIALEKRGFIPSSKQALMIKTKNCPYCKATVGFSEKVCSNCHHVLDRDSVISEQRKDAEILELRKSLAEMQSNYVQMKEAILSDLMQSIQQAKITAENSSGNAHQAFLQTNQ